MARLEEQSLNYPTVAFYSDAAFENVISKTITFACLENLVGNLEGR